MTISNKVPDRSIRVSYYDRDGTRVDNVTKQQASVVNSGLVEFWKTDKVFYFQDKNGFQRELNLKEVLDLRPEKDLISDTAFNFSSCPTAPQPCGPPKVQFFGGEGVGAMANAVISPISSGVMAFDIIEPGKRYKEPPVTVLQDECGKGSGSSLRPIMNADKVQNVYIETPGDGYLNKFDGSLGGNERTWKEADEGYVKTKDGKYYTVPGNNPPPDLDPEDEWNPPITSPPSEDPTPPSYPVIIEFDDVIIEDPGFGYNPDDDTITVIPDNGTILNPIINDNGEVTEVEVIDRGSGFVDLPEIIVNSKTGFNAVIKPILRVRRILSKEELLQVPSNVPIISVIDCVGKIAPKDTFDIVPR